MLPKHVLTDQEKTFIATLLTNGGKFPAASAAAGYHPTYAYQLAKRLREEIIEATESFLAMNAPKAAMTLVGGMDEDGETPSANIRVECAKQILDRVGVSRKERLEVDSNVPTALFILPDKRTD